MSPHKNQIVNRKACREPYAEVRKSQETESVTLFAKRNYKVSHSSGLNTSLKRPINCVFDTSAGPNLLRKKLIEPDWLLLILPCNNPRLKCATNQKVEIVEMIVLNVQIEESHVRVMFRIVKDLAVPDLLGSAFIERCIKVIILIH